MKHSIFALASAQGRAGVAVIRLSGDKALPAAQQLIAKPLKPRYATYGAISFLGEVIDQAIVLYFPAPHSFTGEDCVELHVHGSRAILDRLYGIFIALGLRLAEPGEFSRRAVENGKIDLTQAEGIADLVDAETEAQRQQALTQLDGGLRRRYETWRSDLVELLARLEVYIDFPDEDLPDDLSRAILGRITGLRDSLNAALVEADRGRQIREGYRIVILGEPNAGKSSLFNTLLRTEAAIVTPVAGTTRDIIEAQLRIGPYSVLLYDTAGLHDTEEVVEREGIRRARAKAAEADLRLWLVDGGKAERPTDMQDGDLLVFSKADLVHGVSRETSAYVISTMTGEGMELLLAAIEQRVMDALSRQTFPAATRERHRERLAAARDQLDRALESRLRVPELTAEHVRMAVNSFEALFGRYDVEGVLDVVFSTFCIGK